MTPNQATRTSQNILRCITIQDAFRWVLAWFEDRDNVEPEMRLGLMPDQDEPIDLPSAPEATGALYAQRFTPGNMPRRLGSKSPPRPSAVARTPRIPDHKQLAALLHDREHGNGTSSESELRVCSVHDWLHRTLVMGQVEARAETWIEPRDGTGIVSLGRTAIERHTWARMTISYYDMKAECLDDDYITEDNALLIGRTIYREIELDRDQLHSALCIEFKSVRPLEIIAIAEAEGKKRFNVQWQGRSYVISLEPRSELKERAMRSFEILIQNPDVPISYYLLDVLAGRDVDTGAQSATTRQRKVELARQIQTISSKLYNHELSIFDAHDRLGKILSDERYEGQNLWSWATWSSRYQELDSAGSGKPSDAHRTVVENVQRSINDGIKVISDKVSKQAGKYLEGCLCREPISACFTPPSK